MWHDAELPLSARHEYFTHVPGTDRVRCWVAATGHSQMRYPESDPRHHILKLKQMLNGAANHAREDVSKIADPKAQALFETTAEVLKGLVKASNDFERKNELAWKTAGPG